MSFSNDDIKRLKEETKKHGGINCSPACKFPLLDILALLARLEAAEDLCNHVSSYPPGDVHRDKYEEAWRKACGK